MGAYAPAGCLRGTARGTLALSIASMDPPASMAAAIALSLTPRRAGRALEAGLGWMRSAGTRGTRMWWHNGGTNGSRAFTGFIPERSQAFAAVTNSPRAMEGAAHDSWA